MNKIVYLAVILLTVNLYCLAQIDSSKLSIIVEHKSNVKLILTSDKQVAHYGDTITYSIRIENNSEDSLLYFDPGYNNGNFSPIPDVENRIVYFDYGASFQVQLLLAAKMLLLKPKSFCELTFHLNTSKFGFSEKELNALKGKMFFATFGIGLWKYNFLLKSLLNENEYNKQISVKAAIIFDCNQISSNLEGIPLYFINDK
jgi:hypothetical protein